MRHSRGSPELGAGSTQHRVPRNRQGSPCSVPLAPQCVPQAHRTPSPRCSAMNTCTTNLYRFQFSSANWDPRKGLREVLGPCLLIVVLPMPLPWTPGAKCPSGAGRVVLRTGVSCPQPITTCPNHVYHAGQLQSGFRLFLPLSLFLISSAISRAHDDVLSAWYCCPDKRATSTPPMISFARDGLNLYAARMSMSCTPAVVLGVPCTRTPAVR